MEIRVADYKKRDQSLWPEYSNNPSIQMKPIMGTVVEKGCEDGSPAILLNSLGPKGNMVIFRMSEEDWGQMAKVLADSKARWAKESIQIVKS